MRCCAAFSHLLTLQMPGRFILPASLLVLLSSSALAGTHKRGPYTLENNAYSDQTLQVSGPVWSENSPGLLDPSDVAPYCLGAPLDWILVQGPPEYPHQIYGFMNLRSDIVIEARFLDNTVSNLPGTDIVIFQLDESCPGASVRNPGGYMVAVPDGQGGFSDFLSYPKELAVASGTYPYMSCGESSSNCLGSYETSSIAIDLSDFGVANGVAISALRFYTPDQADPVAIAALHSAPLAVEPTTWGKVKAKYRD
jgi:hypothetical protein